MRPAPRLQSTRSVPDSTSSFTNGRMRLRREGAGLLFELLDAEIGRSIHKRADAKERENAAAVTGYNRRLATLRAMSEELVRLMEEMRWPGDSSVDLRIMVGDIDVTDHARFIVTEI